jgi:transposase
MSFHLDYLLALPGVRVETCTQVEGKIFLGQRILAEGIVCHHCKNDTEKLHQNRPILVRDLSVFGRPVYLKIPRRQFYCPRRRCSKRITRETLRPANPFLNSLASPLLNPCLHPTVTICLTLPGVNARGFFDLRASLLRQDFSNNSRD